MERHTLTQDNTPPTIQSFFKVHVSFLQEQELLVAAENAEAAEKLVRESVLPETQQFTLHSVSPLSTDEQQTIMRQMMGFTSHEEVDPSGEVQDTRILN